MREFFSLGLTCLANDMKLAGTIKSKKRNKVTYFIKSQQKYLFRFFLMTVPANFMPLAMQVRPKLKNSLVMEFYVHFRDWGYRYNTCF